MKLIHIPALIFLSFFPVIFSQAFASDLEGVDELTFSGLRFIENRGQLVDADGNIRSDIKFKGESNGVGIYIRTEGISYVLYQPKEAQAEEAIVSESELTYVNRVDVDFVGASAFSQIEKNKVALGKYNYYLAHCPQGITDVKAYYELKQKNIYDNIDVCFYGGKQGSLKYDIIVNPGGNPNEIKLKYSGATEIQLEDQKIKISTIVGEMTEWMPRVYQNINGNIVDVKAKYELNDNVLSFNIGSYNSAYPLVIDPTWVTYYGGPGDDKPTAIDSDNNSNAISAGYTTSTPFPTSVGPAYSGGTDAYILSLAPGGSLIFCTYFGGSGADRANGITIDASNNIYIAGTTSSAGLGTAGVVSTTNAGGNDAFIAMFNNAGTRQWCTYYGGTGSDEGIDLEFDGAGNILLTGVAANLFPATLVTSTGNDIFLAKFNLTGTNISWSTCIGSTSASADRPTGLDVDANGNTVVTGIIPENGTGFPVTNGSIKSNNVAISEGVIVKFNSTGGVIWSTYFGSSGADKCIDVAIDSQGDIVITGNAWAGNTISQFSPTPGAYQNNSLGASSSYLVKFDGANNTPTVKWFTYFGTNTETNGIRIDKSSDDIFMGAEVYGNGLPNWGCAHQRQNAGPPIAGIGQEDQFMARFDKDGNFLCDTYIGGTGHDEGQFVAYNDILGGRMAIAPNGSAYLTGTSNANAGSWVFPVVNGVQMTSGGGTYEAVVISICAYSCGKNTIAPSFTASKTAVCPNEAITFTDNSTMCDGRKKEWLWSFPGASITSSTDQNPTGISYPANGTYAVKLVIKTPCGTDSATYNSYITVNSPISVISSVTDVSCFGYSNGGGTVGSITGATPFTYQWSSGGTTSGVSGLQAGVYTVTVTDNNGCTSTASLTITEPPLLTVNAVQANSVLCFGEHNGVANAIVNGGTSPYTYTWSTNAITPSASLLGAGTFSVTVFDTYGCIASTTVIIAEPTIVSGTVTPFDALCNGTATGSALVNANGGVGAYSYTWNNGVAGAQTSNVLAGVYTVTITDANGCTGISSGTINEPSAIVLRFSTTDAHCNQSDGSASVNVSGGTPGYNYSWSNSITVSNNNFVPAGNYYVLVTDSNLCIATGTVSVVNLNGVTASILSSSPASCNGLCDGSATAGFAGGIAPYTYSWNNGLTNAFVNGLCAGTFSVTVTDSTGCTDVATITISQPAAISATLQATSASCYNYLDGSINVTNTAGGTSPYNYQWQSGITSAIATGLSSGTYSITITDQRGCTGVFSSIVTEPTPLVVNTAGQELCAGSSVTLGATAVGATPAYTFNWYSTSGLAGTGATVSVTPNTSSTFTVVATDSKGCTAVGYSLVTVNDLPLVNFTSDLVSGCSPLCVSFTNQTPNAVTSVWNFGSGLATATGQTVNYCFTNPGSYEVSLTVTDHHNCTNSLTRNNYITVHPDPIASFAATPNPVSILEATVYFTNNSLGATAWNWSFGDVTNSYSSDRNTFFNYSDTGTYLVTLAVVNEFGCEASVTKTIIVKPDYSFFVPNSFSPNGDGKNDEFLPLGIGWEGESYEFYVYNRWGEKIFSSNDPAEGWNGSYENTGEIVQQDVYVWKIKITDINNKPHRYTGHVTLIR